MNFFNFVRPSLVILLISSSLVLSQDANSFCQGVPPGNYCNNNLNGFYWCVGSSGGTNSFQVCPAGTECSCFVGPSCANVPTVGSYYSPCNRHQTTPSFPSAYYSYSTSNLLTTNPSCSLSGTGAVTVIRSGQGKLRIDTTQNMQQSCGSGLSQFQKQEWFFVNADSTLNHYTYQSNQCSKEIISGPLSRGGVPDGYEYLNTYTYSGPYFSSQSTNVWYFISGETYPAQPYGYWDEIHVTTSGTIFPLYRNHRDDNFRVTTWTNLTTATFTVGEPDSQYFTMPGACSSL